MAKYHKEESYPKSPESKRIANYLYQNLIPRKSNRDVLLKTKQNKTVYSVNKDDGQVPLSYVYQKLKKL